jgi:hypothetical protein
LCVVEHLFLLGRLGCLGHAWRPVR